MKNVLERINSLKGYHILSKQQLQQKYPHFKVKQGEVGIWSWDAAVTNVKNAIRCFKLSAQKAGASLFYGCQVTRLDTEESKVYYVKSGVTGSIKYNTLVMCCGPYTERFKIQNNVEVVETETYKLQSTSGIPWQGAHFGQENFYFLPNDFDINEIKIGLFCSKSLRKIHKIMKERYPGLLSNLGEASPCFFTRVTPTTGLNIYREGNIIWAYGFSGFGFKHGPSMGRKVLRLVEVPNPKL